MKTGVPIGALDEAHHYLAIVADGHFVQAIDDVARAPPIGLNDDAEPVPVGQFRSGQDGRGHLQRQAEAGGLFGVDIEADPGRFRLPDQPGQNWNQFRHDP